MAEELIALDSSNQSAFIETVKNIKKTIKSKDLEDGDNGKYKRGIILVEHIPYGFFEDGLRGFFSQFGRVMRIRLARSKKTGRSKGYAFVEFEFEEVAKISAESMNNYLMFERLIKCKLLPSDANGKRIFLGRHYREDNYPKLNKRNELKRIQSEPLAEEDAHKFHATRLSKLEKHNKRLAELGIAYEYKVSTKASGVKSKPVSTESPKQRTPAPKAKCKARIEKTPEQRTPASAVKPEPNIEKTPSSLKKSNYSPKLLRSRVRQSEGLNKPTVQPIPEKTKPIKSNKSIPKKTPAIKHEVNIEKSPGDLKPKFSPKLLRSRVRQSEGLNKTAVQSNVQKAKQRKSMK